MGERGRPSLASVTSGVPSKVEVIRRPSPPADMTPEQASEWTAVVSRLPADWFPRETHGMLAQYARHVVAARHVAQLIAVCTSGNELDVDQYDKLLKMQEREGRAMSSIASRLRITQQSSRPYKERKPKMMDRPWES